MNLRILVKEDMMRKKIGFLTLSLVFCFVLISFAEPNFDYMAHDRTRPVAPVVDPGEVSCGEQTGTAPSDATVLFNGADVSSWVDMAGKPSKWKIVDGAMECVPGSGYARTLQSFGDCQFHVEWAAPIPVEGDGQGRGNSGIIFGLTLYEIQILDSYQNDTYADGACGSLYGQYPPMANVCKAPGQWQSMDVIYTAPRFCKDGKLLSPAYFTIFQNGVLIQNHAELSGPIAWINRPPYQEHPEKMPISLQDHGNPVRFRNIWVRELDQDSKPELYYTDEQLKEYVGSYHISWGDPAEISLAGHGRLAMDIAGTRVILFCEKEGEFFAKTTDVLIHFTKEKGKLIANISVGDGFWPMPKL